MARQSRSSQQKRKIALLAARLMLEHGIKDFLTAKRKAASQLGVDPRVDMPKNSEIEQAMKEHQRLFREHSQQQHLDELRQSARQALQFFERFKPRVTGPVLSGTADAHSEVNLHLFADNVEDVMHFLHERKIPFENKQRRYRFANGNETYLPVLKFLAGETAIDVTVFPSGQHEAPLSPVDGRAMQRASLAQLDEKIQAEEKIESLLAMTNPLHP
jgi:hypothetical protein